MAVKHIAYVFRQRNPRAYGHHETSEAGAQLCPLCRRLVVRGVGEWWRWPRQQLGPLDGWRLVRDETGNAG